MFASMLQDQTSAASSTCTATVASNNQIKTEEGTLVCAIISKITNSRETPEQLQTRGNDLGYIYSNTVRYCQAYDFYVGSDSNHYKTLSPICTYCTYYITEIMGAWLCSGAKIVQKY